MKYEFDPTKFGFLPPNQLPKPLQEHLGKETFFKVIAAHADGTFWYLSCNKYFNDERWLFISGLYDTKPGSGFYGNGHTSNRACSCCITSDMFAKELLIHLLGTTTNEGTLKYGQERLIADSLPIPPQN